jgi:hypothetical protein
MPNKMAIVINLLNFELIIYLSLSTTYSMDLVSASISDGSTAGNIPILS